MRDALQIRGAHPAGLTVVAAIGLLGFCSPAADAQARAAGLAGAYIAVAAGPQAAAWNPANLAQYDESGVELLSLQAAMGNNCFSLSEYREFNGAFWGAEEKQEILARIEADAIEVAGAANVSAVSFARRGYSFTIGTRVASRLTIPKEYVRLVLYGNTVGETFNLAGSDGEALAMSEARLSAARTLGELVHRAHPAIRAWSVGLSLKYLQGWAYAEILEASGGVTTTSEEITGAGTVRSLVATGGQGFGLDLGFAGPLGGGWMAGVAVRDLFAQLRWNGEVEERTDNFEIHGLTFDEITDETVVTTTMTREQSRVTIGLPVRYALGAARAGERMLTMVGLEIATRSAYGASARPRGAVGLEWRIWPSLALRGGVALGGTEKSSLALGTGLALGAIRFDLAVQSWGGLNPFAGKGLGLGLGFGLDL